MLSYQNFILVIYIYLFFALTACAKGFVDVGEEIIASETTTTTTIPTANYQIKLSPGHFEAKSSDISITATITTTDKTLTSADMSAIVSLHKKKASQ